MAHSVSLVLGSMLTIRLGSAFTVTVRPRSSFRVRG